MIVGYDGQACSVTTKPLPWAMGCPLLSAMIMDTTAPFASRDCRDIEMASFVRAWRFIRADIVATSNDTTATYLMSIPLPGQTLLPH